MVIGNQLSCVVFQVYLQEAKTVNFTGVSTEVESEQGVVSHEAFSDSNGVCGSNFVKAQIKMDNRLVISDGVTQILSNRAWLPMPLSKTIPAQVKYF